MAIQLPEAAKAAIRDEVVRLRGEASALERLLDSPPIVATEGEVPAVPTSGKGSKMSEEDRKALSRKMKRIHAKRKADKAKAEAEAAAQAASDAATMAEGGKLASEALGDSFEMGVHDADAPQTQGQGQDQDQGDEPEGEQGKGTQGTQGVPLSPSSAVTE